MNCLRCGRETTDDHVFCDRCREMMEKYPVHPGTAVILPKRREEAPAKKTKHHGRPQLSAEEQVKKLKKQRRWLRLTVLVLMAVIVLAAVLSFLKLGKEPVKPGQNYSAIESTVPKQNP